MSGKYRFVPFLKTRLKRGVLRLILRRIVRWEPMDRPEEGYTVIIGCSNRLLRMLPVNLEMLSRQDAPNMRDLLIVIDRQAGPDLVTLESELRSRFPTLPLSILTYTESQARWTQKIGWAWVYSWLSWCIGIAATRTRYALLHDFDAMLVRPDILEDRHNAIRERGDEYVGQSFYSGSGVLPTDGLVTTFELMFDAQFVRKMFRPIDLFNHVTTINGRTADMDTFLYAQTRHGKGSTLWIPVEDMVHPSQVICEFMELVNDRSNSGMGNALFVPYFMFASGHDEPIRETTRDLETSQGFMLPFFAKRLDLSRLTEVHCAWIVKQMRTLEVALVGEVRPVAQAYMDAIEQFTSRKLVPSQPEHVSV